MTYDLELAASLRDAATAGDIHLCKRLLAGGAEVNAPFPWTALHAACSNGHKDAAQLLLGAGARLDVGPNTPLMLAADRSDPDLCRLLIDAGGDVRAANDTGLTPLMRAAKRGETAMVQFLIENGAEVSAVQNEGWSALMYAACYDCPEVVGVLVAAGADTGIAMACETLPPLTAFQMAVRYNSAKVMQYMLDELGEDPAQRTVSGRTMQQLAGKNVEAKQLLQATKAARAIGESVGASKSPATSPGRCTAGAAAL
jgi:ankyrin repeat protein